MGILRPVAVRLLDTLVERLEGRGVLSVSVDGSGRGLLHKVARQFATLDEAVRWCEDQLP